MTPTEPHTSYEIHWRREPQQHRTTSGTPSVCLYSSDAGTPLFAVVTHGVLPSEGIFTLIGEAPRIRDEIAAVDRQCDEARANLVALKTDLALIATQIGQLEQHPTCPIQSIDHTEITATTVRAQSLLAKALDAIGGEPPDDFDPTA